MNRVPFSLSVDNAFNINSLIIEEGHKKRLRLIAYAVYLSIGYKLLRSSTVSECELQILNYKIDKLRRYIRKLERLGYISVSIKEGKEHYSINSLPAIRDRYTS